MTANQADPQSAYRGVGFLDLTDEDRHVIVQYPNEISQNFLQSISGKWLADLGAGESTELGAWVTNRQCNYTAIDVRPEALEPHRRAGFGTMVANIGDVTNMIRSMPPTDIVHMRFVLRHLARQAREQAILGAFSIMQERALFIEWDWTTFGGGPVVQNFIDLAYRTPLGQVTHDMGGRLLEELRPLLRGRSCAVQAPFIARRSRGDHYCELTAVAKMIYNIAHQKAAMGEIRQGVAEGYHNAYLRIREEGNKEYPEPFQPPDLVVVEVVRS